MHKKLTSMLLAATLMFSGAATVTANSISTNSSAVVSETTIVLSDSGVKTNGAAASTSSASAVYVGANIVYYEARKDSSYGEGTTADGHTASEAAAHTVVTITKPGTYRVSGTLSAGQLAIDLGSNAAKDASAVVTLILDNANITCTVAPAVIFYNVYECGSAALTTASSKVDTTAAGANVVLADGSVNNINGAYVARIYKEGTTKKLHKYDGAFYAKMSMNINGESAGTGELHIIATNEGLDSELHLTINGGKIYIEAMDDGMNTNEDGVSVTTINGGYLFINAGLGSEGDGIDSNGYLVINGGTIETLANGRSGDGGIDADSDIILNGGTVTALGSRNDASSADSKQAFMELSFATTKTAGTVIRIVDASGNEILNYAPIKDFQSLTFIAPKLAKNTTYYVYADSIQQQYTGNSFGMGMMGGGQRPEGFDFSKMGERPEMPEGFDSSKMGERPEMPEGFDSSNMGERPDNAGRQGQGGTANNAATTDGSVEFAITDTVHSFSGVSDSADASGKTSVIFSVNSGKGMSGTGTGAAITLANIMATLKQGGTAVAIPESDIQITITDTPSENYAKTCRLSDGAQALAGILPTDDDSYQLTIAVAGTNATYTGTSQWQFSIGGNSLFSDVNDKSAYYTAIQFVSDAGLMDGTGDNKFSPGTAVNRAMAITVLGKLGKAELVTNSAFMDVTNDSWYTSYVGWATKNMIVAGYGDGTFGPEDSVTRQQICVIAVNYCKAQNIALGSGTANYNDAASIDSWAAEAVGACQAAGFLDGVANGSLFNPKAELTRAELSDILMRLAKVS